MSKMKQKIIDFFFGRNKHTDLGKIHIVSKQGKHGYVAKELKYTLWYDGSRVTFDSYDQLVEYCGHTEKLLLP